MENVNKNWVLGRPLVHGDLEQIAEIARINKEKDIKNNIIKHGINFDSAGLSVSKHIVSFLQFKCFKCENMVRCRIEGIDLTEETYSGFLGQCITCRTNYESVDDNNIIIKK